MFDLRIESHLYSVNSLERFSIQFGNYFAFALMFLLSALGVLIKSLFSPAAPRLNFMYLLQVLIGLIY